MKTCECHAVNPDEAKYCASCGRILPVSDAPVDASSPSVTPNSINQRRAIRFAAIFIATALVVAVGLTVLLRNVHIQITSNNLQSVQLPLNICKTSVGDSSETPATLPATVRENIPKQYRGDFAFYTDNEGLLQVLAPSGWTCTAAIGADGSSSVQVSPAAQSVVPSGALSAGSAAEEVSASQTSACVGCREALACPLFSNAASDYVRAFQHACPTTRPPSESTTTINADVVEFTDPPGVHGDANPSGGSYPAMGIMIYYGDAKNDGGWTETCVLPPNDMSQCKVIVGNFDGKYFTH